MDDVIKRIYEEAEKKVRGKMPDLSEEDKKIAESFLETSRYFSAENIYTVAPCTELVNELMDNATRFKDMSEKLYHEEKHATDTEAIKFENKVSRLLLGISCELILKSMFLLKGYCINRISNKNKKFPTKLEELKEEDGAYDRTVSFTDLLKHLNCILPPEMSDDKKEAISKSLSIAKDWRDNESHFGVRHSEFGSDREAIKLCIEFFELMAESLCKKTQN